MPSAPDFALILNCMRPSLRGATDIRFDIFIENTLRELEKTQLFNVPDADRRSGLHSAVNARNATYRLVVEAFFYLLHTGMITRAPAPPNFPGHGKENELMVTDRGRTWAAGNDPIPEDSARYVKVLTTLVPALDPVIAQYVQESLVTYQRQAYFAAAVMIGAASEKAVYLLADSMAGAIQAANEKKRLIQAIENRSLPKLFHVIRETLNRNRKRIPYGITEGSEQHLLSFFESIRVQRNEAVHPNAARVTPSSVQLSLAAFPNACRKVYDLIEWFQVNSI